MSAEILPKSPTETYLIIFLALFISEKVVGMGVKVAHAMKGRNGNGKDKEKRGVCLTGLINSPAWETHKTESHDTCESSKRNERSLDILKRESLIQTREIKAQTAAIKASNKILEKIANNGSIKKAG